MILLKKHNGHTLWKWELAKQKSLLIIWLIFILKKINQLLLIIAPKSVYTVGSQKLETHLPKEIQYKIYKWNIDKPKEYDYKLINLRP